MKKHLSILALALALGALMLSGQQGGPKRGQTYAELAKLPDWSGAYVSYQMAHGRLRDPADATVVPPLKPADLAKFQEAQRIAAAGGDNTARARAGGTAALASVVANGGGGRGGGFTGATNLGPTGYMEILFTPGRVTLITSNGNVRRIYTDGTVADPTFISAQGTSTGHWEGDVLVVDTIGLNPKTTLLGVTQAGEGFKVHERMFMKVKPGKKSDDPLNCQTCDGGVFEIDATIEAPEALTAPYKMPPELFSHLPYRNDLLQDYVGDTAAFDRSVDQTSGKQTFNLTPPADLPPPPPGK